jgi:inhibitor of KinA sporulation pathway (predicted exonuclease)
VSKRQHVEFKKFGRREIDVKTLNTFLMISQDKSTTSSLKSAMGRFKMQFQGTPHRADVDASNTLALFFGLLRRQSKLEDFIENVRLV